MNKPQWKMLNGLCVPITTPDDYFAVSAKQWLANLGKLIKAAGHLKQLDREMAEARAEYQKES